MWNTSSPMGGNFSKSENEILSHPMTDLDLLDILLGTTSRTNNNNNNSFSNDTFSTNLEKSFCSNVRHRAMSCSSIVMEDDFQVGGLERWEPGEVLDRSTSSPFSISNSSRETRSEPGTPNKHKVRTCSFVISQFQLGLFIEKNVLIFRHQFYWENFFIAWHQLYNLV
jgi:hypothetical protein